MFKNLSIETKSRRKIFILQLIIWYKSISHPPGCRVVIGKKNQSSNCSLEVRDLERSSPNLHLGQSTNISQVAQDHSRNGSVTDLSLLEFWTPDCMEYVKLLDCQQSLQKKKKKSLQLSYHKSHTSRLETRVELVKSCTDPNCIDCPECSLS